MADDLDREARRAARAARVDWVVRVVALGDDSDDLSASTTPAERWEMMWALAQDAWAAAGLEVPTYARGELTARVRRLHDG